MTGPQRDDELLAELGAALAPPDVPPAVLEAARAVFTWRTVDEELAALVHDSAESGELAGVRGVAAARRRLSFRSGGLVLEIELEGAGLLGQVVPAGPGTVEVQALRGTPAEADVDEVGSFAVPALPDAPFRLAYTPVGGRRVVTAWVTA